MAEQALITGMGGHEPDIDVAAFAAPTSVVIGEVTMAAGSSAWYQAVLRADCAPITIGADSNIQDNCSVHADPGFPVTVGERVSVGHNAVLHGCTVEDDVLVGMGATVLNGAHIGAGSLIAAQALVPQGMQVPPAQTMPPSTLAIRNFQYGIRRTPASGPAKIRSSATKRPKNTAHMPHFWNDRSAVATCAGPKWRGNLAPSQDSSGCPPLRPIR